MFAGELQRRSDAAGWGLLSTAAHPGASHTNLQTSGPNLGTSRTGADRLSRLTWRIPGMWQDAAGGARPTLYAALDPAAAPDGYYGPQKFFGMNGPAGPAGRSRRARDTATAARLWDKSVALTGVRWGTENVVRPV
jgi:hypothetical protein